MKKVRSLSKRVIKQFLKVEPLWSINAAETELKGEFAVIDHIHGLMLVSKIIIVAHVQNIEPVCTLYKNKIKVSLKAAGRTVLQKQHLEFAKNVTNLFLSTKDRRTRYQTH